MTIPRLELSSRDIFPSNDQCAVDEWMYTERSAREKLRAWTGASCTAQPVGGVHRGPFSARVQSGKFPSRSSGPGSKKLHPSSNKTTTESKRKPERAVSGRECSTDSLTVSVVSDRSVGCLERGGGGWWVGRVVQVSGRSLSSVGRSVGRDWSSN